MNHTSSVSLRLALFTDTFTPQLNGVARTLARLTDALETRGHVVRVFTTADPEATPDPATVRYAGRPFWAYPQLRLSLPKRLVVERDLRAFAPNLVHVATPFGLGLAGSGAALRMGVPVVSSYHTSLTEYATFYGLGALTAAGWAFLRWFHNRTRRTYCPTLTVQRDLEARRFSNVALWSRGVDTTLFNRSKRSEALRTTWGAQPWTPVVGYVGRIAREKGIDVMLDAMRLIRLRNPETRFVIVGDGPFEYEARRAAPRDTAFTGRLSGEALAEAYASFDCFLFPSTTDTFGNVLLEAMASGVPVVAADVPQSREVLGRDAAVFAKPGNGPAFADAAVAIIRSDVLLQELALGGRRQAQRADWNGIWSRLIEDYVTVVTDRSAISPGRRLVA